MSKRQESKYKIDRRLGVNLWGRAKSPLNKREYGPGQHGQRRKKPSDYGLQLMAKQKLKGYYANIGEKQFRKIYQEAVRRKGDTGENLIGLLERRLDAVVYRMKLVPTPFAARQFINHGHVLVNGRRVNIPSFQVKVGDVIEVRQKSKQMALVLEAIASGERDIPDYLNVDTSALKGTFVRVPLLADVPSPVQMDPNLVSEFYPRGWVPASLRRNEKPETFGMRPFLLSPNCRFSRRLIRTAFDGNPPKADRRGHPASWLSRPWGRGYFQNAGDTRPAKGEAGAHLSGNGWTAGLDYAFRRGGVRKRSGAERLDGGGRTRGYDPWLKASSRLAFLRSLPCMTSCMWG